MRRFYVCSILFVQFCLFNFFLIFIRVKQPPQLIKSTTFVAVGNLNHNPIKTKTTNKQKQQKNKRQTNKQKTTISSRQSPLNGDIKQSFFRVCYSKAVDAGEQSHGCFHHASPASFASPLAGTHLRWNHCMQVNTSLPKESCYPSLHTSHFTAPSFYPL